MGTISINFNNLSNKKIKKPIEQPQEKIILTYHDCIQGVPEYYTYLDVNNNEAKFTDNTYVINKISSSKYVAKKNIVNKIPLTFISSKDSIEYKPAYFTYDGNNLYTDKVIYDEETCTYKGILENTVLENTKIIIYEE